MSVGKAVLLSVGLALLVLLSSLTTLLLTHNQQTICPQSTDQRVAGASSQQITVDSASSKSGEWDAVERLNIEEKGITVVRVLAKNKCYIRPLGSESRPLIQVPEALSEHLVEELGGVWAVQFCEGLSSYLLRDVAKVEESRRRRQATDASQPQPQPQQPQPSGGSPTQRPFGTSRRPSGLDLDIDQRNPRCDELILDCVTSVGKVQTCYTWINGVIKMDQKCESPTVFKVFMTKPPGRMLKIAQEQWKICVERRKTGLKC